MHGATKPMTEDGVATPISIAVVEHDDRFLIGQRANGVVLAGFWEFPGGKVQPGETPAECAARECLEETALEVEVIRLLTESVYEYDHGVLRLRFFQCRPLDPAQQPQVPFRWVERRELSRYTFPPANTELLRMLAKETEPARSP